MPDINVFVAFFKISKYLKNKFTNTNQTQTKHKFKTNQK